MFQPFSQIYSVNIIISHVICTSFLHSVSRCHANLKNNNNNNHNFLESEKLEAADLGVFCFKITREGQTRQKCSKKRFQFIVLPPSYLKMSLQPASSSSSCPALSSRMAGADGYLLLWTDLLRKCKQRYEAAQISACFGHTAAVVSPCSLNQTEAQRTRPSAWQVPKHPKNTSKGPPLPLAQVWLFRSFFRKKRTEYLTASRSSV